MHRRQSRLRETARWAAVSCAVLISAAACSTAGTTSSIPQHTSTAAPQSTGSSSGHAPPCAVTPAAGPAHSFTFPQSIAGFTEVQSPQSSIQVLISDAYDCDAAVQDGDYENSQDFLVSITVGHHSDYWKSYNQMWGGFWGVAGLKVTMIAPGPLGGQAGCGTNSMGTTCTWIDNDSFGILVGDPGMSVSQTEADLVTFRDAVEHTS